MSINCFEKLVNCLLISTTQWKNPVQQPSNKIFIKNNFFTPTQSNASNNSKFNDYIQYLSSFRVDRYFYGIMLIWPRFFSTIKIIIWRRRRGMIFLRWTDVARQLCKRNHQGMIEIIVNSWDGVSKYCLFAKKYNEDQGAIITVPPGIAGTRDCLCFVFFSHRWTDIFIFYFFERYFQVSNKLHDLRGPGTTRLSSKNPHECPPLVHAYTASNCICNRRVSIRTRRYRHDLCRIRDLNVLLGLWVRASSSGDFLFVLFSARKRFS